jgi:hypothetical protein
MSGVESFKTYQRSVRAQVPEDVYNKGMQYTNAPLSEGFCRLMLNYDLKDSGNILTPRLGLKSYDLIEFPQDSGITYGATAYIAAAKEKVEENGAVYQQFIVGDSTNHSLYVVTNSDKTDYVPQLKQLTATARIKTPDKTGIHGISLDDKSYIARPVGTFAFNDDYYFVADEGLRLSKFFTAQDGYWVDTVTPRELTPSEAVMWGYNMLKTNPYTFQNTMLEVDSPIYLDGVLPYDAADHLVLSPQVNQALHFECFYRGFAGKVYTVKWEWKDPGSSTWDILKTGDVTLGTANKFICNFSVPNKSIMLRVKATNKSLATDMQVMTIGFDFSKSNQGNAINSTQTVYDLRDASGMTFWKNRLVIAHKNMLFLSEVNDPGYFPYPNNMEPFSENIIHVMTCLDNLLVFTTTKLYSITLGQDGTGWFIKQIQGNLAIQDCDIHLIQAVKNMVFFKSGNYYYMVVPKAASTTGELTIAPVSRPIEPLLDNFQTGIEWLLKTLYDYTGSLELLNYYNFLDFEDVHNVYVFQTDENVLVNIALLYNTVLRVWRLYVFESQHTVKPFKQDATTKGTFMALTSTAAVPCIQLLKFDSLDCIDSYVVPGGAVHEIYFKNYQMLDTGYREISSNIKKRFREAQLRFYNRSGAALEFYTEFYIDGDTRKTLYKYTPHHETDPTSPDYGLLTMARELVDPSILPGMTILAETEIDYNYWTLDASLFPDTALWKVRIPFSGKGYSPRMLLVSFNQQPYELLNNLWVFRQLNSR